MPQSKEILEPKKRTYQALELAIKQSELSVEEIASELQVLRTSFLRSINRKTLRLETLYKLEIILKKKIVYSHFDQPGKTNEILEIKIKTLEGIIKEFAKNR